MPNEVAIRTLPAVLSPEAGVQSAVVAADWSLLAEAYRMRGSLRVVDHLLPDDGVGPTRIDHVPGPSYGTVLGEHVAVATTAPAHLWQARLVPEAKPYPGGHRIHGVEVVPVSVLLQTLSAAAAECGASMLGDVRFEYPIVVDQPRVIQVVADDESVTVSSSPGGGYPRAPVGQARQRPNLCAAARRRRGRHRHQRRSRNARLRPFVGRRVAAGVGHRGAAVRMVDRLLPVGAGWIARRCRPAGGVDGRTARRRRSRRPPGGQLQPAADVSGRRRKCLVCSRTRRCAGFRRGTSARRQRRRAHRRHRRQGTRRHDMRRHPLTSVRSRGVWPGAGRIRGVSLRQRIRRRGRRCPQQDILSELEIRLRAILARELGMPAAAVGMDRPFPELGLDSMMAMNLLREAKQLVGIDLSATMLWNHPTISSLAAYLAEMLTPEEESVEDDVDVMHDSAKQCVGCVVRQCGIGSSR